MTLRSRLFAGAMVTTMMAAALYGLTGPAFAGAEGVPPRSIPGSLDDDPQARLATCTGYPSRITIASPGERGTPMVVSGQVVASDGRTPAAGVTLYVYQTDASGLYNTDNSQAPRIRGWLTTDADGRYEYRTIRPAPYPGGTIPAHVHTQLWGRGVPLQYNNDLNFQDDPAIRERDRQQSQAAGRFAWVLAPVADSSGVLRVTHDLRAKAVGDSLEGSILHGVRDCRPPAAGRR